MARLEWERKESRERVMMEIEIERERTKAKDENVRVLFGEDVDARTSYLCEEMRAKMLLSGSPGSLRTVLIPHDVKLTASQPFVTVN